MGILMGILSSVFFIGFIIVGIVFSVGSGSGEYSHSDSDDYYSEPEYDSEYGSVGSSEYSSYNTYEDYSSECESGHHNIMITTEILGALA